MKIPRIAIVTGYGINSDLELAESFRLSGGAPSRVHINDLIGGSIALTDFDIVAIPGGFSFGDHIGSGKVFANKLRCRLADGLRQTVDRRMPVIGICNGFQVLVKLGILPETDLVEFVPSATLTFNDSGKFEDRWCHLRGNPSSNCVWTKGIESIYLPVRHGEGKFIPRSEEHLVSLHRHGQVCMRYTTEDGEEATYPSNPNGSVDAIAGVCNREGMVFGLMPHPEAFMLATNHPRWQRLGLRGEGEGLKIFRNAIDWVRG